MLKKILSITCKVFIKEECLYQHEFFTYYITISVCSFIKSESVFCMVYFVACTKFILHRPEKYHKVTEN